MSHTLQENLAILEKRTQSLLSKHGYLQDVEKIPYQGIRIKKVTVYAHPSSIKELLKQDSKIRYS